MHYVAVFYIEENENGERELSAKITLAMFGREVEFQGILIYWEEGDSGLQWKYGTPNGFDEGFLHLNDCQEVTSHLWLGCFDLYEGAEAWTNAMIEIFETDLSDRQLNLVGWQNPKSATIALA